MPAIIVKNFCAKSKERREEKRKQREEDENRRREAEGGGGGSCVFPPQWNLLAIIVQNFCTKSQGRREESEDKKRVGVRRETRSALFIGIPVVSSLNSVSLCTLQEQREEEGRRKEKREPEE